MSTTDQKFSIGKIMVKAVYKFFINFRESQYSIPRVIFHNILIKFGTLLKVIKRV
jgi:hypothetical protein